MDPNYPEEKVPVYRPVNQPLVAYSDQTPQEVVFVPGNNDPATHQRRSRKRRIARVVLTLFTLWVAYIMFFSTVKNRGSRGSCHGPESSERHFTSSEEPFPPDVTIDDCANLTQDSATAVNSLHGLFSSSATFELPLSSEKLFLLSRGVSAGSVNVIQSNESGENAKVQVVATYRDEAALDHIKVCSVSRSGDQRGVGIFSPRWRRRVRVNFDIEVRLPSASGNSPLQIKNFETDLPLFAHNVGRLAETVHFGALSLRTSLMQINVGSVSATQAQIVTSNAKIEGTFNTSSGLDLATSNAPININVGLHNSEDAEATRLTMSTSNAALTARMDLTSGAETGGQFKVSGSTSMGPVDIAFTEAPVGSSLTLDARTSLAPATVQLHKTYEGEFTLSTSLKHTVLSVDDSVEDPEGKGRKRAVDLRQGGSSYASGSVSWAPEGKYKGSVKVQTSLAPVILKV